MNKVTVKQHLKDIRRDLDKVVSNIRALEEWIDALPREQDGVLMPDYDDDALMLHVEAGDIPRGSR